MLDKDTMRVYMANKRQAWREQGKCPLCGYDREDKRYVNCGRCREQARNNAKRRKANG